MVQIMHWHRIGARAGPVSGRTIFVQNSPGIAREQPGNRPYGARECVVTGA